MEDPNKPVTGYPQGYHQGQASYNSNDYPPVQSNYSVASIATGTSYPYIAPPPVAYYSTDPYYTPITTKGALPSFITSSLQLLSCSSSSAPSLSSCGSFSVLMYLSSESIRSPFPL
uniref:Uncharacterized protein n=1 Tax=Nelumbo nucifera TaxID=4432 RepID=A0A822ZVL1_NELNU|nr:TPA_asm: hypothetical protein HUJ06_016853 [Nelumbo nucifera]